VIGDPLLLGVELPAEVLEAIVAEVEQRVVARLAEHEPPAEFLTVDEAADLLRAKPQRVYDLCSAGVLRRFKDGARTLISRSELLEHLGAGCPPVAQARGRQRSAGVRG
jgi:excisionase family DNA binding protein